MAIQIYDASIRPWVTSLQETWAFRETVGLLTYQRLATRYRRSLLGFLWAFLNPLLQIAVLAVVFGLVFHRNSNESINDALRRQFAYIASGLLPWQFFSGMLVGLTGVFVGAEGIIKKIYLPLLIFPVSQLIAGMIDLVLAILVLCLLLLVLGIPVHPTVLLTIPGTILLAMFTLGLVLLAAVANVYFRDMGFIIGVLMQIWFYLSPVIWQIELMPPVFQIIFKVNPFWNFLLFFRLTVMDGLVPGWDIWLKCSLWGVLVCTAGYGWYRSVEHKMIFRL